MLASGEVGAPFFVMTDKEAIAVLRQCLLPQRWERLATAAYARTRRVTVAFDSLAHSHNVNAVLRTCECLGVQDVHMVTGGVPLQTYRGISRGALEWLSVHEYATLSDQLKALREAGYRLVGTAPQQGSKSVSVADFDSAASAPLALLFGQEKHGMSAEALAAVEVCVYVPMVGLTESLNVSVAAGMLLGSILEKMAREGVCHRLNPNEADALLLSWLKKSVKSADLILSRYAQMQQRPPHGQ